MMVHAKEKFVVLKNGMQLFDAYVIPPPPIKKEKRNLRIMTRVYF